MTSSVMDGVNARTQLVGRNRLELLLFTLGDKQRFGINVFKVREVIKCPSLTHAPYSNRVIRGMANIRGQTITIMDLAMAIGKTPINDLENAFTIITEYNRHIQGFLVNSVDRIVNLNWEDIKAPPCGIGCQNFLTAVTRLEDELVEIIDVEKVMGDVLGFSSEISDDVTDSTEKDELSGINVLVVDDSSMARKQIIRVLDQMNVNYTVAKNGREAFNLLTAWTREHDTPISEHFSMVLSDVEMPEMDGYTLTKCIKEDPAMSDLYVMLHSSLSGAFNENMVKKVGADEFLAKYNPDELAERVLSVLRDKKIITVQAA